ncbi:MAG: sulfoxide reductase heme-binding subunit YedZ [Anaerolineales bacterium]|nr:sulfoxide reductase heme-binding subunit YedZ [Anaerolineales bacterium]
MKKYPFTPLQIIMHLGAWYPLAKLAFDFLTGNVSPNPIQDMEQRTGRAAVTFLVLSLACSPFSAVFGWKELLKRRRALGLYAFLYASLHMLIFVNLDYGLAWSLLYQTVLQKPYILVGVTAFLLLVPLAITSFPVWQKRLKKNWKRLHRIVYVIGPLVILHYAWAKKGDLLRLQGDILRPAIYGLVLLVLLILRWAPVRKGIAALGSHLQSLFTNLKTGSSSNPG